MDELEDVPLLMGSKYRRNSSINSDGTDQQDSEGEEGVTFFKRKLDKKRYGATDGDYFENESHFRPYSLSCFGFRHKSLKRYTRDLYHWILSRQQQWTDDLRQTHTQVIFPVRHPGNAAPPLAKYPSYIPKKVANLTSLDWLISPVKSGVENCPIPAISVQSSPDAWENVQLVVHSMEGGSAQVTGSTVASLIPQGPGVPSVATFSDIRIRRAGSYVIEVRSVLRPHVFAIAPLPVVIEPNLYINESTSAYPKHTSEDTFVFFGPLIGLWTSAETFSY